MVLHRGESIAGNLVLTTELSKLAIVKGKKADVLSISPSSEWLQFMFSTQLSILNNLLNMFC